MEVCTGLTRLGSFQRVYFPLTSENGLTPLFPINTFYDWVFSKSCICVCSHDSISVPWLVSGDIGKCYIINAEWVVMTSIIYPDSM